MRITSFQVEASYGIASRVFDRKMTAEAGAIELQSAYGLNINSARDFINDYRHMLQGKVFHRAMSAPAIDYYLSKLLEERGQLTASISAQENVLAERADRIARDTTAIAALEARRSQLSKLLDESTYDLDAREARINDLLIDADSRRIGTDDRCRCTCS